MQSLRRVIFATLPTMVALLGFVWFRRKKKAIADDSDKGKKGQTVPLKKNNNIGDKEGQVVNPSKDLKKKNTVHSSLEDNIMSTVKAAPLESQQNSQLQSSREPTSKSHVDKVPDSCVRQSAPSSNAAPSHSDNMSSNAPIIKQEKVKAFLSNAAPSKGSPSFSNATHVPKSNTSQSFKSQEQSSQKVHEEKLSRSDAKTVESVLAPNVESVNGSLTISPKAPEKVESSCKQTENKEAMAAVNEMVLDAAAVEELTRTAEAFSKREMESAIMPEIVKEVSAAQKVSSSSNKVVPVEPAVSKRAEISREAPQVEKESLRNGHAQLVAVKQPEESDESSDAESIVEVADEKSLVAEVDSEKADTSDGLEQSEEKEDDSHKKQKRESAEGGENTTRLETQINGVDHVENQNGLHSDSHSEVSSDSGKGNSVGETPQTTSPTVDMQEYSLYEFDFPSNLCGRLIGRMGKNINSVKDKTGADIFLKRKPFVKHYQICCIQGTHSQVNAALAMIKKRFPPEYFEDITYEQLNSNAEAPQPVLTPEIMQLSLPEGVSVDVIVSSVVDVSHVFVQQPTHPTFSCLERLNFCMNACYGQDGIVPQLPRPIEVGVICAAPIYNGWYRAQVVVSHTDCDEYDIKFVDYGGYVRMQGCQLRQIRSDFTTLPFQAVECYVSNIVPPEGEEAFPPEASAVLENLVQGKILQAQIVTHEEDGVPYVQLYELQGDNQAVFVNREIVNQNVAQWMEFSS